MRIRLVIAVLMVGLLALAPAVDAIAGSNAVASKKKKKCKKALWKCAPKRYHLSVTDDIGPGPESPGLDEHWKAEVDLVRVARSIGKVDYGAAGAAVSL